MKAERLQKLSPRAWEILLVIDERSKADGSFFYPYGHMRGCDDPCKRLDSRFININGSGDARIIKSLASKGLIQLMPIHPYASKITEEGRLLIERSIELGLVPLQLSY